MSTEDKVVEQVTSVSDMLRTTADNQSMFLTQIADHVDRLESVILKLEARITEMEKAHGNDTTAQ
jgi:hypothetical protein